jgi:hypothetical protein
MAESRGHPQADWRGRSLRQPAIAFLMPKSTNHALFPNNYGTFSLKTRQRRATNANAPMPPMPNAQAIDPAENFC